MTENRDFLEEMQQLRAETNGIRNALVSNPALSNNSVLQSVILEEIARELKNVRSEIKEMKKENEKKLEEMKMEIKQEIIELKLEFLQENQQLQQKIDENEKKNEEKMSELQKNILGEFVKKLPAIQQNGPATAPEIPIREAILGEWKMVGYENREGAVRCFVWSFEKFSENVKYELEGGKLKHTGGMNCTLIEQGKVLYVEDNHVKTSLSFWKVDRYIQDAKLHVIDTWYETVGKRIYEKI